MLFIASVEIKGYTQRKYYGTNAHQAAACNEKTLTCYTKQTEISSKKFQK